MGLGLSRVYLFFFFFNDTATTEIYTLSLHGALPIYEIRQRTRKRPAARARVLHKKARLYRRSEEHTSELQSHLNLVCRLLLEKKKKKKKPLQLTKKKEKKLEENR